MIVVELDTIELMIGALVGVMRRVHNIKKREVQTQNFGMEENATWNTDANGALAELAVAKHLGIYWGGAFFYKDKSRADVGAYHVRSCTASNGHLIVRPKDSQKMQDDARIILVIVKTPKFVIAGSHLFGRCKLPEYWREDQGSWWVPQGKLDDLTEEERA